MKQKILLIISLFSIFMLTGCTNNIIGEKTSYDIKDDKVTMEVKVGTLTKSGATIVITNKTNDEFTYGEPYHLEKKVDNIWYILEPIEELNFTMPAYQLASNYFIEKEYNWEYGYGKLKKGTYRLVTDVFSTQETIYIAAEFTIK